MSFWTIGRFALVLSLSGFPLSLAACVVDSTTTTPTEVTSGSAGGGGTSATDSSDSGAAAPGDGTPSEHPILAPIDSNQTMTAAPGQGVGVFAEYYAGGAWNIWWTCDSIVDPNNVPCQFDVKISVATGTIALPAAQGFQTTDTFTSSATRLEGVTLTTVGTSGVTFQTSPGATITLSATVGGQYDGRFIFFVEGGKVDDGFTGTVTDPIELVGSSP
jgi:hypothetical protein